MMQERTLREDLYYRLRGIEIVLPTLEERREDIPRLARHFAGEGGLGFAPEALEALSAASWPGNVRQLRNMVQGARAIAGEGRIGLPDLPIQAAPGSAAEPTSGAEPATALSDVPRGVSLREVERWAIERALQDCAGNRTRTAEVLGIDRSTLRRKMAEYEID